MTTSLTLPAQLDKLIPKPIPDISCHALLEESQSSSYKGFLRKEPENKLTKSAKGILGIKWPQRFVVLYKGCVYLFKAEDAQKSERATSLFGYDSVVAEDQQNSLPWVFKVVNRLTDKEKTLRFSASTEDDRNKWIERFNAEMLASNAPLLAGRGLDRPRDGPMFQLNQHERKRISTMIDTDDLEYVCMDGLQKTSTDECPYGDGELYDDIEVFQESQSQQSSPHQPPSPASSPPLKPQPIQSKLPSTSAPASAYDSKTTTARNEKPVPPRNVSGSKPEPEVGDGETDEQPIYDDIAEPHAAPVRLPQKQPLPTPEPTSRKNSNAAPPPSPRQQQQQQQQQQSRTNRPSAGADGDVTPAAGRRPCPQPPPSVPRGRTLSTEPEATPESPSPTTRTGANKTGFDCGSGAPKPAERSACGPRIGPPTAPKSKPTPPAKPTQPNSSEPPKDRSVPPVPMETADDETDNDALESYSGYNAPGTSARDTDQVSVLTNFDCARDPMAKAAFYDEDPGLCSERMSRCDQEGMYMIRNPTNKNDPAKTLLVRTFIPSRQVTKFRLVKTELGRYMLQVPNVETESFKSISDLFKHYQNNCLPGRTTTLSVPYSTNN